MHSDNAIAAQGRYSDGRSASSLLAEVRLSDRGVEIGFPGAPQALVWPYGALGTATPLTRKAGDALLTYSFMPGASLFVADPAFIQAVIKRAPQLTSSAYVWQAARPWIMAAAAIVVVIAGLWAAGLSPARWIAGLLPDRARTAIGEQVIASMVGARKECTEAGGRAALDRLVARLTPKDTSAPRFKVRVVDWGLLNAFAVPGEQIVLTRAIVTRAKSPEEVAGVLAHEMGHGIELHPETAIVRIIGLTAALELMTGGGGTLANIGLGLTQLSYTRVAEREADARGLALLEQAQISASGLIDFFRRIGEIERKAEAGSWDIFRSHPQSAERAEAAAKRAKWMSTPAMSAEDWAALRTICGAPKPGLEDADAEPRAKR